MISVERMDEYCRDKPNGTNDSRVGGFNERRSADGDEEMNAGTASSYSINTYDKDNDSSINDHCSPAWPWPWQGRLEVTDLVMRYRHDLSPSLKGVNLLAGAGEKVRARFCAVWMLCPRIALDFFFPSLQSLRRTRNVHTMLCMNSSDVFFFFVMLYRQRHGVIPSPPR